MDPKKFDLPFPAIPAWPLPVFIPRSSVLGGVNITIVAQRDIAARFLKRASLVDNSSGELPTNWLYRRGNVDANGLFTALSSMLRGCATDRRNPVHLVVVDFSNSSPMWARWAAAMYPSSPAQREQYRRGGADECPHAGQGRRHREADRADPAKLVELAAAIWRSAPARTLTGRLLRRARPGRIGGRRRYHHQPDAEGVFERSQHNIVTWLPTTFFLGQGQIDVTAGRRSDRSSGQSFLAASRAQQSRLSEDLFLHPRSLRCRVRVLARRDIVLQGQSPVPTRLLTDRGLAPGLVLPADADQVATLAANGRDRCSG